MDMVIIVLIIAITIMYIVNETADVLKSKYANKNKEESEEK